ncbi:unnamed protein product [Caenorhabditis bovis]|uniref:ATP-dependent helicase C-terminal domain-containing protein n=1 Tax=Caenorhabditis bovis TaxID=2654633 RepID=A0A8S1FAB6_9PELO|nr:unnamed protein product [Caenorhabditis bovis]
MDSYKPSATAIVCIEKWLYFQTYFGSSQYQSTYRVNISIEDFKQNGNFQTNSNNIERRSKSGGPRNMKYFNDDFSNDSFDMNSSMLSENGSEGWLSANGTQSGYEPIAQGKKATVNLWCMSPALSFIDAFNECRSVILASGTLCPMETLKTELGMEFKQQAEGDQVIPSDRIFAAVLPIGPSGSRIQCTYRNTANGDSIFYKELSSIITYVCVNVPAGILCFLPSYRVLDLLKTKLETSSYMQQIENKKLVLFEPRRSSELASVMAQFDEAIFEPHLIGPNVNGALMFAVFRGKVSEGIDFADDRARVVISVGIPFPSSMDELVNAKRVYNDENSKKLGILNGEEWYVTQAYRALNQALGRCLRHKNDWGALLLIDERLERQVGNKTGGAASAKVSKWIRTQLKSYPSFGQFDEQFRCFMQRMLTEKMNVKEEIDLT